MFRINFVLLCRTARDKAYLFLNLRAETMRGLRIKRVKLYGRIRFSEFVLKNQGIRTNEARNKAVSLGYIKVKFCSK